jgi:chemotaxis protein methyltransferase CheR
MSKESLPRFYAMLEKNVGIALDDTKQYLLESRLLPIANRRSHSDVYALIKSLTETPVGQIHWEVFEALTTNETSFFRDKHVYEALQADILPKLIEKQKADKSLRIWSAACSSGQEAYSLAMLLREEFSQLHDWSITIQGTDLSDLILEKAKMGIYSSMEAHRGLEPHYLQKYFTKVDKDYYQLKPVIREMVSFSHLNLLSAWPFYSKFDLILLRNVLIYFNQEVKEKILTKIHQQLNGSDSILLMGAAESIYMNDRFKLVRLDRVTYYNPTDA